MASGSQGLNRPSAIVMDKVCAMALQERSQRTLVGIRRDGYGDQRLAIPQHCSVGVQERPFLTEGFQQSG
jgi:hypothetical protein